MIKYILPLFVLFTICQLSVTAQNGLIRTSIYEEGKEVKSFEDNFDNLKTNWKRITNHADFEIVSCEYVYTFKNKKQIKKYAKQQTRLEAPFFTTNMKMTEKDGKMEEEIAVRLNSFKQMAEEAPSNEEGMKNQYLYNLELQRGEIENAIKVGDRVYAIHYKVNGKVEVDHVVCSAETYKVICKSVFRSISFRKK